jgi:hypothetical protein
MAALRSAARVRAESALLVLALAGCPGGDDAGNADTGESSSSGPSADDGPSDDGPTEPDGDGSTGDDPQDSGDGPTGDGSSGGGSTGSSTGSTGSSSSTGDDSSTDSGTTGDDNGTTGDDNGTTGDDNGTTGDDNGLGGCADACEPGCTDDLMLGLLGTVQVEHDGTTILGRGEDGRAGLWRASDLAIVYSTTATDAFALAAGIAAFEREGQIEIVDAGDGDPLGTIATDTAWGLAQDGSYVWTAGGAGLSRWEVDGTPAWTLGGDFSNAQVLALSTELHAFAPADAAVVHHVAAADGTDVEVGFAGDFAGWFADQPRFWTEQGDSYRLYEADGTQLAFELGDPMYGWGDRLALAEIFGNASIVDIADTAAVLAEIDDPVFSRSAVIGIDPMTLHDPVLLELDDPALVLQPIAPSCCIGGFGSYDFAWASGAWALGGEDGELFDEADNSITPGEILHAYGASAGRIVAATALDRTHVFDVDDACALETIGDFPRDSRPGALSDDGLVLMSPEKPYGMGYSGQLWTRFYDTTTGAMTAEYGPQLSSSTWMGGQISADGGLYSSSPVSNQFFSAYIATQPGFVLWEAGNWALVPGIAPDGVHAVYCDAAPLGLPATFEGSSSYVLDEDGLVSVFDGAAWGFLANDRLLVGHYVANGESSSCWYPGEPACDDFVSSDVVDLDGSLVAATTLPETRYFERVSDTEIFTHDTFTIWDVYGGEELWQAPDGTIAAAAVGTDFVVTTDGAVLTLTKWR